MCDYHQRRPDQNIDDPAERLQIIRQARHVTLAICEGGEPYLATVNYGYDEQQRAFYFHCSPKGRKVRMLRANPVVWGQVLDDLGYVDGRCLHGYRTVQFRGRVSFLEDPQDKRRALYLMIDQLESDPARARERFVDDDSVRSVAIGRVDVESFSAKRGKVD
jgi:nitroimidazol reductase NimA-like FMN-containing flavoprotein (pyridoxamine 5'-phosphate oxidase superfamily)